MFFIDKSVISFLDIDLLTQNFKLPSSYSIFIKRKLWTLMLDFAQEHDFGRGDSEWHMFDAKHNILLASSGKDCPKYNTGFHAMFLPEQVEQSGFYDFRHIDDEMWILWDKMKPSDGGGNFTSYSIRDRWNAQMSYKWLTEEFIPYVVLYYEVSKKDNLQNTRLLRLHHHCL